MDQYKDVFIYNIFNSMFVTDLARLKQVNRFFNGTVSRQIIIDKILVLINSIWRLFFSKDAATFKQLLVQNNCIVLWSIKEQADNVGLDINILAYDPENDCIDIANDFDYFMHGHNYSDFKGIHTYDGMVIGYYPKENDGAHMINVVWFRNNKVMDDYILENNILDHNNSYTICKETNQERIQISC